MGRDRGISILTAFPSHHVAGERLQGIEVRAGGLEPSDLGSNPGFATPRLCYPIKFLPIPEPIQQEPLQVTGWQQKQPAAQAHSR